MADNVTVTADGLPVPSTEAVSALYSSAAHSWAAGQTAWRPIETCPTGKGAEIMAIWFDPAEPDTYDGPERIQMNADREAYWNLNSMNLNRQRVGKRWPTHWMPLPSPPT